MAEFYPMPLFVKLSVRDVAASADWYAAALGFRSLYALPGPDGRQMMNHIRLGRYQDLMLVAQIPGALTGPTGVGVVINLTLAEGVDGLAERAAAAGAAIEGPTDMPWNARELTVTDPDGYALTFSQVIDATLTFDQVMPT